jgi:membrane-associated phospholipid phosphatase
VRNTLFILLLIPVLSFGQFNKLYERQSDGARFMDGVGYGYTAPLRWKGKDWIKLGGILAGTTALTLADRPIRNFWANQNNRVLDGVHTVGYHYGKAYSALFFTGGFYFSGLIFKDEWARETGLMLGTSLFSTALMEMTLKPAVGRARPSEEKGNYALTFFNKKASYHSFPSGHTGMAFTISMVLANRIAYVPVKIVFYSLAASTVVCRLYADAHWISDVAFGGTIAWFVTDAIIKRMEENRFRPQRPNRIKWQVEPYASGFSLRGRF